MRSILITGGCGFVGSALAESFQKQYPNAKITVFDNLKRRGSEFNVPRLTKLGIEFVHGDIRAREDLFDLSGNFDLFIEASAEPSVLAGLDGSPDYAIQTNLVGTLNCLEFARQRAPKMIFLSTSRVYSIAPLREIAREETDTRFAIKPEQTIPGITPAGVAEVFPTQLPRSIYGGTKLCSEIMLQEYIDTYNMEGVINRCGVIAGPGQFGKVDQGVFTMWVARHHFEQPLSYMGFGGTGKQVRDLLHPQDLFSAIQSQLNHWDACNGDVFNVGGGADVSVSLAELTDICQKITGKKVQITAKPETSPVDIPIFITDSNEIRQRTGWSPAYKPAEIVADIYEWLRNNEPLARSIFVGQ